MHYRNTAGTEDIFPQPLHALVVSGMRRYEKRGFRITRTSGQYVISNANVLQATVKIETHNHEHSDHKLHENTNTTLNFASIISIRSYTLWN